MPRALAGGIAGVPRVPGPFLDNVRDGVAAYVRKNKLDHQIIVGHSLGWIRGLDLAIHTRNFPAGW